MNLKTYFPGFLPFAVTLASSGEYTLDMTGELLTHKDTNITKRCAKFLPEAKQKAADRAAELLITCNVDKVKKSASKIKEPKN